MAGSLVIALLKWSLSSCQTLIRCSLQQSGPSKRLKLILQFLFDELKHFFVYMLEKNNWCLMLFHAIFQDIWNNTFLLLIELLSFGQPWGFKSFTFCDVSKDILQNSICFWNFKSNQTKQIFEVLIVATIIMFKIKNSKLKKQFLKLQNVSKQMLPLRDSCEQIRCLI